MRLPWPFRRSAPDGGATAPASLGTVQRVAAPVRRDWASTGDLRPSFVGDPGIRVQRFPAEIAGSQPPPPILGALGHARGADGPAGLVTGLARPTLTAVAQGSVGRADMPLRHRRAATPVAQRALADDAPIAGPLPTVAADPASAGEAPGSLPVLEARRVPVVSAPTTSSSVRPMSLTVARTPDLTLAPARVMAPPTAPMDHPTTRAAEPAPRSVSLHPVGAAGAPTRTILRTPEGSRVRLGPPIQRSTLGADAPHLDLARPLQHAPATVPARSIQRHPSPDPGDHAGNVDSVPDAPLVGGLSTTLADEVQRTRTRDELVPSIPGGLVLARAVAEPDPAGPRAATRPSDPLPDLTPDVVAPILGVTPIASSITLQPTVSPPDGAARTSIEPASPGAGARSIGSRSVSQPTAQRATNGPEVRSAIRAGISGTARARLHGSDIQPPAGPAMQRAARAATAPGMSADRPSWQPALGPAAAQRLVLARTPTAIVASAHDPVAIFRDRAASGATTPLHVQRDAADPVTPERDAAEPDTSDQDVPATTVRSVAGPAATSSPSGTAGGPIPDRDIDEMVRRLYPRLRRSLSSELLVARERAGTLADLR